MTRVLQRTPASWILADVDFDDTDLSTGRFRMALLRHHYTYAASQT